MPRSSRWRRLLRQLLGRPEPTLDPYDLPPLVKVPRSFGGWRLEPGELYLGSTWEYTEIKRHVPYLDGRSSLGRLGVFLHVTAGRGDVGFKGRWTCELVAVKAVWLYPRMRVAQLTLHEPIGLIRPYEGRYQGDAGPVGSRLVRPRG
jgi:dCTP deaminase